MCLTKYDDPDRILTVPSTMSYSLAAVANAMQRFFESATAMPVVQKPLLLSMPAPGFLVNRIPATEYKHHGPGRIYEYRIAHGRDMSEFTCRYRGDLMGYGVTVAALDKAITNYIKEFGPIRERFVVLQTGDWTGRFVVDENTGEDTLVLRLIDTADTRLRKDLEKELR